MVEPPKITRTVKAAPKLRSDNTETSDADWEVLGKHLEQFLEAWEAEGFGPPLADHLPRQPVRLRRKVLIEVIKVDLEYRYNSDGPILTLEDYLSEYPELGQPEGVPAELIHEEYYVRKSAGHSVTVDECLQRFPAQADSIQRIFKLDATAESDPSGTELLGEFSAGDHIQDFYLVSALGSGAFGSVFLARQESMQRMVALKISSDKGTEGQTLAQLDHPNIVRVYDQVRLPDQNLRLLYMQFAAGGTLQAVVRASRDAAIKDGGIVKKCVAAALNHTGMLSSDNIPLKGGLAKKSWAEVACQFGVELAKALQYAHDQGTLHRDVKPANVLLDITGTAKLADFNISFGSDIEGDDAASSFGGSLAYMSPEQLNACHPGRETSPNELDGRSDIFSLGIMLWELFYGHRPYPDDAAVDGWSETLEGMHELRMQVPKPPPTASPTPIEARLISILQKCLQPEPTNRYATAGELARDLSLTLQPRVAQLMQQNSTGWRGWALGHPLAAFLVAAIGPHVFAAAFNLIYNDKAIAASFSEDNVSAFTRMVIAVNAIAFPVGFICCIWFSRPVTTVIGDPQTPATDHARLRNFKLSRFVTQLGITEWTIAGMIYPIGLRLLIGHLDGHWYLHFFWSLLICGLIAAAYPFFLTATLSLRAFLPAMLKKSELNQDDVNQLQRLSNQSAWSLYLAGGVPAAGIMILLTTQEVHDPLAAFPLRVLSVLGAVGFAVALSLARSLQSDVEAFQEAYRLQADSK